MSISERAQALYLSSKFNRPGNSYLFVPGMASATKTKKVL